MLKNKKLECLINNKYYILILFIIIFIDFLFIGAFRNTYIQKEIINKNLIKIENVVENQELPNNHNGNIFIIIDNFSDLEFEFDGVYGRTYLHGEKVLEEFNKVKNSNDKLILLNNSSTHSIDSELKKFILYNQNIVSFIKDDKYYYYEEILDKIIKDNPNVNIIVNQSFFSNDSFNNNIDLLNKYNNLHIIQAMPYKGNNKNENVIEIHGKLFDYNHSRLLYVTKCEDYQPSFSKNILCSEENTSFSAPKLGYEYFKNMKKKL